VTTDLSTRRAVQVILRARFRASWRRLRRRRFGLFGLLILAILVTLAGGALGTAAYTVGRGLTSAAAELAQPLARFGLALTDLPIILPNIVFMVGWVGLFFLTFASLLGTLYLRQDLPMLLVAPVPIRAVFIAQFTEALALPLLWTLALGLPVLVGFGLGMGYGPVYFLLALALLCLLPMVPLGLSALCTLVLLRYIPAPRASEILTVIGTLFGVSIWVMSQSAGEVLRRLHLTGATLARSGLSLAHPALPWAWAARGLIGLGTHDPWRGLLFVGLFAGLSLGVVALGIVTAERLYYDGWVQGRSGGTRERGRRTLVIARRDPLALLLPGAAVAIARKDWRLMRRDPRGYASLIWIFAMLGFWAWRLRQPSFNHNDFSAFINPTISATLSSLLPVGLALLLGGLRWGMEAISRDQRSFQIVQAAPVPTRQIVLGKWLSAYLPSLALATVILTVFSFATGARGPVVFMRNLATVAPILAAETALMLAFGAARPNFDWTDPRQMAGGMSGCLGGLAAWLYMSLSLGIVALGLLAPLLLGWPPATALIGWLIATVLAVVVVATAFTFASDRLGLVEL
jgi:ABC-2 type transport system permease protein